jgi:AcrB/AcrD/AcrF family protein
VPVVVEEAVGHFTRALFEAVAIVLIVSFLSLGLRAGLVVALSIPLVLAMTFMAMSYLDISLQRISLGALIIALGLLVDDAMIAVETMVSRLERGDTITKAATFAYADPLCENGTRQDRICPSIVYDVQLTQPAPCGPIGHPRGIRRAVCALTSSLKFQPSSPLGNAKGGST